jgi:hypothetical protein
MSITAGPVTLLCSLLFTVRGRYLMRMGCNETFFAQEDMSPFRIAAVASPQPRRAFPHAGTVRYDECECLYAYVHTRMLTGAVHAAMHAKFKLSERLWFGQHASRVAFRVVTLPREQRVHWRAATRAWVAACRFFKFASRPKPAALGANRGLGMWQTRRRARGPTTGTTAAFPVICPAALRVLLNLTL